MDGEVTIKTSLDTKSFDAQIRKVEEELNDLERAYKILKETEPADSEILKTYAVNIEKTKNKLIEDTNKIKYELMFLTYCKPQYLLCFIGKTRNQKL